MTEFDHFNTSLFSYLKDLEENNNRDWFNANKDRYESKLRSPSLKLIRSMEAPLENISEHFLSIDKKSGGSLLRIYRDVRFGKDKTPYKTNVGISFKHEEGKDIHAPSYYLHLANSGCFLGIGMWAPATKVLFKIRTKIIEEPDLYLRITKDKKIQSDFEFHGSSLKRAPKGFDPEDPMIEHLRRKSFIILKKLTKKSLTTKGFQDRLIEDMKVGNAFMQFLCDALEIGF